MIEYKFQNWKVNVITEGIIVTFRSAIEHIQTDTDFKYRKNRSFIFTM